MYEIFASETFKLIIFTRCAKCRNFYQWWIIGFPVAGGMLLSVWTNLDGHPWTYSSVRCKKLIFTVPKNCTSFELLNLISSQILRKILVPLNFSGNLLLLNTLTHKEGQASLRQWHHHQRKNDNSKKVGYDMWWNEQCSKIKSPNVKYKTREKTGISKKFGGRIWCHGGVGILTDHTRHVFCRSRENN